MEFKKWSLKIILWVTFPVIFLIGLMIWEFSPKADSSIPESVASLSSVQIEPMKDIVPMEKNQSSQEDAAIQVQLDRDREEQKQTKYLKTKLEQTNLELEEEKAVAEINKLKVENGGTYKEPGLDGQKNLPEIKVEYIGGNSFKKEAILSIAGSNYQVKEKSYPVDNIQIMSISDSSVTLHFSGPQELTKTIDYKPE